MRHLDYGSLQAYTGQANAVPIMLREDKVSKNDANAGG